MLNHSPVIPKPLEGFQHCSNNSSNKPSLPLEAYQKEQLIRSRIKRENRDKHCASIMTYICKTLVGLAN